MAEVSEVHLRVNGWCHTCGGLGETTIKHEDRFANDGVINIEQFRRPPRWVIRPPENVYWTPDEIAQIGRAVQSFQAGLPGVVEALDVSIEGLQVLPPGVMTEPKSCAAPVPCPSFEDVELDVLALCDCFGRLNPGDLYAPGCPVHDPEASNV